MPYVSALWCWWLKKVDKMAADAVLLLNAHVVCPTGPPVMLLFMRSPHLTLACMYSVSLTVGIGQRHQPHCALLLRRTWACVSWRSGCTAVSSAFRMWLLSTSMAFLVAEFVFFLYFVSKLCSNKECSVWYRMWDMYVLFTLCDPCGFDT